MAKKGTSWTFEEMRNTSGDLSSLGWQRIENLTKIILKKHFPIISIYKDLLHIGISKAAEVIKENPENGSYRSIRTYLYTCIRNEISNYLYHTHKRTRETSDSLALCKSKLKLSIDENYVEYVFSKLSNVYQPYKDFFIKMIRILTDSYLLKQVDIDSFYSTVEQRCMRNKIKIGENDPIDYLLDVMTTTEKNILSLIVYEVLK